MASKYPIELKQRAVQLVHAHLDEYSSRWACVCSIGSKLDINPQTLNDWVNQDLVNQRKLPGATTVEQQRIRELERENKQLKRSNEILKAASAFFARELDPQPKQWLRLSINTENGFRLKRSAGSYKFRNLLIAKQESGRLSLPLEPLKTDGILH